MFCELPEEIIEKIIIQTNVEDVVKLSLSSLSFFTIMKNFFKPNAIYIYPFKFIEELYNFCCEKNIWDCFCNLDPINIFTIQQTKKLSDEIIYYMFETSLKQGHKTAYYDLGKLNYFKGNFKEAFECFILFEEECNDINISLIYQYLGIMYKNGNYVIKDYEKAKEYFERSIKLEEYDTYINYGDLYYYKLNNNEKAFECYNNYYIKCILGTEVDPLLVLTKISYLVEKNPLLLLKFNTT